MRTLITIKADSNQFGVQHILEHKYYGFQMNNDYRFMVAYDSARIDYGSYRLKSIRDFTKGEGPDYQGKTLNQLIQALESMGTFFEFNTMLELVQWCNNERAGEDLPF